MVGPEEPDNDRKEKAEDCQERDLIFEHQHHPDHLPPAHATSEITEKDRDRDRDGDGDGDGDGVGDGDGDGDGDRETRYKRQSGRGYSEKGNKGRQATYHAIGRGVPVIGS